MLLLASPVTERMAHKLALSTLASFVTVVKALDLHESDKNTESVATTIKPTRSEKPHSFPTL